MPSMAGPEFAFIVAALARLRVPPDVAWLNRRARARGVGCAFVRAAPFVCEGGRGGAAPGGVA